jgi:D-alanyl-D-alanine carboxypeptidase (penicillin-binding protein 5/6)
MLFFSQYLLGVNPRKIYSINEYIWYRIRNASLMGDTMKKARLVMLVTFLFHFVFSAEAAAEDTDLTIASESAILIDAKTGYVIYEKNSQKQMYPASITKLVTAIVALESADPKELVVVSEKARNVEGTRVYLEPGETVTLHKLLQGLLINSGNDAGVAIAEHIDGSVAQFAHRMNVFVREKVGVQDSTFVNPHGLFDENHYTTAYDMAEITRYALKNKFFTEIIGTETLPWDGESWDTTLINHHKLLSEIPYEGVIGGKNGYVDKSGHTLVTVAERGDTSLIAVTLNASGRVQSYKDTIALFDFGFEHYNPILIPKAAAPDTEPKNVQSSMKKVQKNLLGETDASSSNKESNPSWGLLLTLLSLFVIISSAVFLRMRRKNSFEHHN